MSTVDFDGARWKKSSYGGSGQGSDCVEVAFVRSAVAGARLQEPVRPSFKTSIAPEGHHHGVIRRHGGLQGQADLTCGSVTRWGGR
ncbi:DUF397 domain-containing protein [Amycolatopsis sp. H20-H5]|uniref:DUF397 domain-containing protein n=1 Tax=Amycolatopsis sp. H20-H5 TaxID=3046309 RepID=UPI002DB9DBBE|nr:DUF397 domain-containing protein [Amycolatopsis sp. H20-H5]MEC3981779.1 DUF397 domain-containing protein [Amycolatopsis sp. H20-H5]